MKVITLTLQRDEPVPYHTSILSGHGWVLELYNSHPERIHTELEVHKYIFKVLLDELQKHGHMHSKSVVLKGQLAIFLYIYITGQTTRHVEEHF